MNAVVKRNFLISAAIITTAIIGCTIVILHATSKSELTKRITESLSEASGHNVKLTKSASLEALFPRIIVAIPSITSYGEFEKDYSLQTQANEIQAQVPLLSVISGSFLDLQVDIDQITAVLKPLNEDSEPESSSNLDVPEFDLTSVNELLTSQKDALYADVHINKTDVVVHQTDGQYQRWQSAKSTINMRSGQGKLTTLGLANYKTTGNTSTQEPQAYDVHLNWTLQSKRQQTTITTDMNVSAAIDEQDALITNNTSNSTTDNDTNSTETKLNVQFDVSQNLISLKQATLNSPALKAEFKTEPSSNDAGVEVNGQLSIEQLDIEQTLTAIDSISTETNKSRIFDYTLFKSGINPWLHVNIETIFNTGNPSDQELIEGSLHTTINNGNLLIDSDKMYLLGGTTDINISWSSQNRYNTQLDARVQATDMDLNHIRTSDGAALLFGEGLIDLSIALRGQGPSPGHVASSMNGFIQGSVDSAVLNKQYATAFDRGVVSWALEHLSVTSRRVTEDSMGARLSDPLAIECASLRILINEGRAKASNGIVVEMLDNTLYGTGFIDFHKESLGVAFRTRRKSLFDWSAISIIRYLEVSGTLAQPSIQLNARELARQGVLSASSLAWGPLPSIVYSMAESGLKNRHIRQCFKSID